MSRYTPFVRAAAGGGAYCTRGRVDWIIRSTHGWHLVRFLGDPPARGLPLDPYERKTLGAFPTLGDAVTFYRREVTGNLDT